MSAGQKLELGALGLLQVEKIVPGGDGFLHLPDGRSLFVRGAAAGDKIRPVSVQENRGRFLCQDYELVEAGPDRIEPECPVASRCGGCDLMHLSRDAELREKAAMLREALGRTGGVASEDVASVRVEQVGAALGYRSRVRFHVSEQGKLGFFARGSHELVEPATCAVAHPEISRALGIVRRAGRRFPGALPAFSELELRAPGDAGGDDAKPIARFFPRDGIRPARAEPFLRALAQDLRVVASEREAQAISERRALPGEVHVEIPADAFSQINVAVNDALVAAVVEGAVQRQLRTFCDLFAGAGNFSLPLAKQGLTGVAVEKAHSAVMAASRAAKTQALAGLTLTEADAEKAVRDFGNSGRRFDLVVLDPPRDGAPDLARGIAALASRAVAYVACDPVTLARDVKLLTRAGFALTSVRAFDMFPRTHHFETLVWLDRAASSGAVARIAPDGEAP